MPPLVVHVQVLPSSLHLEVALAASRLVTAAGIAEGAILDSGKHQRSFDSGTFFRDYAESCGIDDVLKCCYRELV